MRSLRLVWLLVLACALCPTALWGQAAAGATGSVTGTVTDQTSAAIVGATVTLTDTATGISKSGTTNSVGLYVFTAVRSGTYDLSATMPGFRKAIVPGKNIRAGETLTVDLSLQVGSTTQTVEIKATPGAQLQTLNAAVGASVGGNMIVNLPTIDRDVSGLLYYQPTAMPSYGAQGNLTSGSVAGHQSDQNTYLVDGGYNTSDLDGDNGTYVWNTAATHGRGVVPSPAESVEEFKVTTNNQGVDFSLSGGGQVSVVTKRGGSSLHGTAFDFFQADWLSSNDWFNNNRGIKKPKAHFNRFGGDLGGPLLPPMLGGKTYFYAYYEGQRFPLSGPRTKVVPSALFRQGIFQIRDSTGSPVQYDFRNSSLQAGLTQCGAARNLSCDPRLIGFSSIVNQMWSTYLPAPNDFKSGDLLNTFGYIGILSTPISNNDEIFKVDHDFGSKYRWFGRYQYYSQLNPLTRQVDWGGLVPGHTKGIPAIASKQPLEPRSVVSGLTTTFSPNLVNDFHFTYLRNFWAWNNAGALPQISGIPGAIGIGGESSSALIPMNIDTQSARKRLWNGHDWDYRDTLSVLHGKHFFQFGGEVLHQWWHFDRYDNVVGGLTQLVYDEGNGQGTLKRSTASRPPACTAAAPANCLPSNRVGTWYSLLAQTLGIIDQTSIVATRSGPNLSLNPLGSPVQSYTINNAYFLYFSDAYKPKPNLTFNYGLNWGVQMPPYDINGVQDIMVDEAGNPVQRNVYFKNRQIAALQGQVYNPIIGFSPVGRVGNGKYPYAPFYGGFMPRVSLAWSPNPSGGFLATLFGHKATVLRGGYGRFYDRSHAINLTSTLVLGDGFLQPVACLGPSISGACGGGASTRTISDAFRIGTDGNVAPLPAITPTLPIPVLPGVNSPAITLGESLDSAYRPGVSDQIDFSIQRELKGNMLLEFGWVGNWTQHLFQGLDINAVPWMTTLKGQNFAQAYDNLWFALCATPGQNGCPASGGKDPAQLAATPQPFLEAALAGSPYCAGFTNCTQAVAVQESGNILVNDVSTMWADMDGNFTGLVAAPGTPDASTTLLSTKQAFWPYSESGDGFSNYQAFFISLQKRTGHGLAFNTNFTYSHALGTSGLNQAYTLGTLNNPWNLRVDYGPQYFDRKFTFNFLGTYQLPFGPGRRFANSNNSVVKRVVGGWSFSPIFILGSGLPLFVATGSFGEFGSGQGGDTQGANAVPLVNTRTMSNSPHFGVVGSCDKFNCVGINSDPKNGGVGVNLYKDPLAVYNSFMPCLVGICGRGMVAGYNRGQVRWNLDFSLNKETQITERVKVQFHSDWFNALNHMQWGDPGPDITDPNSFGAIGGQYNPLRLGGFGAAANYTRIIQLGLRVIF